MSICSVPSVLACSPLHELPQRTVPHDPPRHAVTPGTSTQQGEVEGAHPRRIARQRHRGRGKHPPPGLGSTGRGLRPVHQQDRHDAGLLRRQCQPATCRQVEQPGHPPAFHHQCAQFRAAQRIDGGAQQHRLVRHRAEQHVGRVHPQFDKAGAIGHPAHARRACRAQPEDRPHHRPTRFAIVTRLPCCQPRQHQAKGAARPGIFHAAAEQFMHASTRKAATQRRVQPRMAREHPPARIHGPGRFQRGNPLAKRGKRIKRLAHYKLFPFRSILYFVGEVSRR